MITAHGKKALLVKGDYHPAEAYAGVERVATVERTEIVAVQEGEGAPTPGVDLYIDEVIVSTSGGVTFDRPLQPGTYTFTARVVSEKENTRCLMLIGGTWYNVTPNGELETFTLTLTKSDSNLTLYSAGSYDDSLGYSATWSDIHITSGNIRPIHGIDRVVVDCTDGTCHTVMLPHTSYGGYIDWARRKYVETHDILYLPVAEMCNSEGNPGWSVGEQLRRFLPAGFNAAVSGVISNCTSYVYANTMYINNILFISSSKISQSAYIQNYPDLVFEFCLPLVEPIEYDIFLPNSSRKYAGWHDEAHEVADEPVVFTGTYNDQVQIHAVGTGYQETMTATPSATGSLVQAEIPAGQPLDVRVDISAKETPPTTNLVQKTIPAVFDDSVTGDVLLTVRGLGFQQTFDATEAVSGRLVQTALPAGQPLNVRLDIEATQDGEGVPAPNFEIAVPDQAVDGYKNYTLPKTLSAGEYTMTATIDSSDTDGTTSVVYPIYSDGAWGPSIAFGRNAEESRIFNAPKPIAMLVLCSGGGVNDSIGDTSTWSNVTIRSGNVRPIHGTDEVFVSACGRNLWNFHVEDKSLKIGSVEDIPTGFRFEPAGRDCVIGFDMYLPPNITFRLSAHVEFNVSGIGPDTRVLMVNKSKTDWYHGSFGRCLYEEGKTDYTLEFTTNDSVSFYHIAISAANFYNDASGTADITNISLEVLDNASGFMSYDGISRTIRLPETSYGGYIDWSHRKYIQTWMAFEVRPEMVQTTVFGNNANGKSRFAVQLPLSAYNSSSGYLCNTIPPDNSYVNDTAVEIYGGYLLFAIPGVENLNEAQEWFAQNETIICYPLESPIEQELPDLPTLTASADGVTTVYSDAASVIVNGAAVPTPENPSDLLASESQVLCTGLNLWNKEFSDYTKKIGNITEIPHGYHFEIVDDGDCAICYSVRLQPNTYYQISAKTDIEIEKYSPAHTAVITVNDSQSAWYAGNLGRLVYVPGKTEYVLNFCTNEDEEYTITFSISSFVSNNNGRGDITNIMLKAGVESAEYVPYQEPRKLTLPSLRAIPGTDVCDELRPVLGMPGWYNIVHKVGEYICDGSEPWRGPYQQLPSNCFYANTELIQSDYGTYKRNCIHFASTHFKCATGPTAWSDENAIASDSTLWFTYSIGPSGANIAEFINAIRGVTVWGELETPVTERVYLGDLKSFPHRTNLTIAGELLPEAGAKVHVRTEGDVGQKEPGNPSSIVGMDSVSFSICGRNLLHIGPIDAAGSAYAIICTALKDQLNALPRNRQYRFWYNTDADADVNGAGAIGFIHAKYAERALPDGALTARAQPFSIEADLELTSVYGANNPEATYSRLNKFCLTADGSDPRIYSTYNGADYHIELPETSYGGYIDWARSVYVQTMACVPVSAEYNWRRNGDYIYAELPNEYHDGARGNGLCNFWPFVNNYADSGIFVDGSLIRLGYQVVTKLGYTLEAWVEMLRGLEEGGCNPIIVYQLASPVEYLLTGLQVLTASSDCITTVWSNAPLVTLSGGAVPSPFHPSNLDGSDGKVISCGRNLFDKAMFAKYMEEKFGSEVIVDGKTCNRFFTNAAYNLMMPLVCEKNEQYAFSCLARASAGQAIVRIYYSDGTKGDVNAVTDISEGWNRISYVTAPGKTVVGIGGNGSILAADLYLADVMLEKGAKAGTYVPFEQTGVTLPTLRAIPSTEVYDELQPVAGQPGWYDVIRKVAEHTFTGEEGYTSDPAQRSDGYNYIYMSFPDKKVNGSVACNHLPAGHFGSRNNVVASAVVLGFVLADDLTGVSPTDDKATRVAKIHAVIESAYNKGDPYVVWYELAQPVVERVYLGPLRTYPRYTSIHATGDLLPTITATAKISD